MIDGLDEENGNGMFLIAFVHNDNVSWYKMELTWCNYSPKPIPHPACHGAYVKAFSVDFWWGNFRDDA